MTQWLYMLALLIAGPIQAAEIPAEHPCHNFADYARPAAAFEERYSPD
jgi:hypothetical protein